MDQGKLNSICQEMKNPSEKIKLQKKDKFSYAAAVRKGNSKTNLFRKKSNTNI